MTDSPVPTYSRDNLPHEKPQTYARKITQTKAIYIDGPFRVETIEGVMGQEDGWLAFDSQGNPYPIADNIFRETFHERALGEPPSGNQAWKPGDLD